MTSPRIAATALNICESGPRRSDGRSLGIRGVDVGPEKRRPWRRRLWRRRLWRDGRLRITAARAALRRLETKVCVRVAKAFTADDLTHTKGVVCRVCTIIDHWRMLRLRIMGVADVGGHLAPTPNTAFDGRLHEIGIETSWAWSLSLSWHILIRLHSYMRIFFKNNILLCHHKLVLL